MATDTPRAGETWERVRDGRRVEVANVFREFTAISPARSVMLVWPNGRTTTRWADDRFLREFRRVTLSDGRET